MTIAVDLGRKATKQTNKQKKYHTYGQAYGWGHSVLQNTISSFQAHYQLIFESIGKRHGQIYSYSNILDKLCRPRSDCRVLHVWYSDMHFVKTNPEKQHFICLFVCLI